MVIPAPLLTALAHTPRGGECYRWTEVAVTTQIAGQLRVGPTGIVLIAALPGPLAARRFARLLRELDPRAQLYLAPPPPAAGWTVIARPAAWLARRSGLLPGDHDALLGLPTQVLHGPRCCAAAAWRAARPATPNPAAGKRETGLVLRCPNPVLAVALAGLGRRLGARAHIHSAGHVDHVTLLTAAAIDTVLHAAAGPAAVTTGPSAAVAGPARCADRPTDHQGRCPWPWKWRWRTLRDRRVIRSRGGRACGGGRSWRGRTSGA